MKKKTHSLPILFVCLSSNEEEIDKTETRKERKIQTEIKIDREEIIKTLNKNT